MTDLNIVVMDTETTGLSAEDDRLVELAGEGMFSDIRYSAIVNPHREIALEARAVHHLGPKDVADGLLEHEALALFDDTLLQPDILVAHNAKFDRGFIDRIDPNNPYKWICTYKCSLMSWPDAPGHGNQLLRYYLGIDDKGLLAGKLPPELFPHRALYDVIVTKEILRQLLGRHNVADLIRWSNTDLVLKYCTFGKHKGKLWSEVDYGYLKWCVGAMDGDIGYTAQHHMRNYSNPANREWRLR